MNRHASWMTLTLLLALSACVTTEPPKPQAAAKEPTPAPKVAEAIPAPKEAKATPLEATATPPLAPKAEKPMVPPGQAALDPTQFSALTKRNKPAATPVVPTEPWSYQGQTGPANWGSLNTGFTLCSEGRQQSPMAITTLETSSLEPIGFRYRIATIKEVKTANQPRFMLAKGGGVQLRGTFFALQEIQLHLPAEHVVEGKRAALEVQLLHRSEQGEQLAVAVLLDEGSENVTLHRMMTSLPGVTAVPIPGVSMFNPANLLPGSARYFSYEGSLTTPPCSEGVSWLIMHEHGELSSEQLTSLGNRFNNTARPSQPPQGRKAVSD